MRLQQVEMNGHGSERGASHQSQTECRAHHAHAAGTFLTRGHTPPRWGCDGQIAAETAAHDARQKEKPKRTAAEPHDITQSRSRYGEQKNAATAATIAQ